MRPILAIAIAISSLALSACGGGGSTETAALPAPPAPAPAPAIPLQNTSYGNAKLSNWIPADNPDDAVASIIVSYGDFHRNGQQMMFVANNIYDWNKPIEQAIAGTLGFYAYNKATNKWIKDTSLLPNGTPGCIHARKAVVADLNGDGVPDVFLACHGYDRSPFPGEKSMLFLSQPGGKYAVEQLPNIHYTHGATAVDINGDGKIDIVEANGSPNADTVLINDGTGHFTERPNFLPASSRKNQNYSVEALDLNGDSKPDLIFSGSGNGTQPVSVWRPNTTLLINDGRGTFALTTPAMLPVPGGEGRTALDFYAKGRDLYLLETPSENELPNNSFYKATIVRKVNLDTMTTTDLYNAPTGDRWIQWNSFDYQWTAWMIPVNGKLVSQASHNKMSVPLQ